MDLKLAVSAKCFAADVAFERFHISMNTGHVLYKVSFLFQYFLADMAANSAHLLLKRSKFSQYTNPLLGPML